MSRSQSERTDWISPLVLTVYVAIALALLGFFVWAGFMGLPDRSGGATEVPPPMNQGAPEP